jgi:hypothetical protein
MYTHLEIIQQSRVHVTKCDLALNVFWTTLRERKIILIGSNSPLSAANAQSYKRRNNGLKAVSLSFTTSSKKAEMIWGSPWHRLVSPKVTTKRLTSLEPVVDFMFTPKPSRNTEKIERVCSWISGRRATRRLRLKKTKKAMSPSTCSCRRTSTFRIILISRNAYLFLRFFQIGPQIAQY